MARVLVVGATGHVGSQVVRFAEEAGHTVTALVRRPSDRVSGASPAYVRGDLNDPASLAEAVRGCDVVVSTANAIIPVRASQGIDAMASRGYANLIEAAERAGAAQLVQASAPSHDAFDRRVPELAGKRRIEERLRASPMHTTIVRNPAFTDVWLVMVGAGEAASRHPHATTARQWGFLQRWQALTGRLVTKHGLMLAPGGADHGAPLITTEDVARMLAGSIGVPAAFDRVIEAGGPEWLRWQDVAALLSERAGRKVRCVPMAPVMAATGQAIVRPFSAAASNVLGLVRFVAAHQPAWQAPNVVAELGLPPQKTVARYLEENWRDGR